jgi:hypothetical protein
MSQEYNDDDLERELKDDGLVDRLVPDPGNPDVTVLRSTFIGKGTRDDVLRIYTSMDFSEYFEVPKDKVLGAKRYPSGRLIVWLPSDVQVRMTRSKSMSAEYLKGSIQASYLRRSQGSGLSRTLRAMVGPEDPGGSYDPPFCKTDHFDPQECPEGGLTDAGCPPPSC